MTSTNSTLTFLVDFATNGSSTTTPSSFQLPVEGSSLPISSSSLTSPSTNIVTPSYLPGCLPTPATSILFQLSHIVLLLAYLTPNIGSYGVLAMHSILALGHFLLTIWAYGVACYRAQFPTLIGWSIAYLLVNTFRAGFILYGHMVKNRLSLPELTLLYETLFKPIRVTKADFQKLVSKGRLVSLAIGEIYAIEGVTETNRLALLVAGK